MDNCKSILKQFKPSAFDWFFQFDQRSFSSLQYVSFTEFDILPGSGSMVLLHIVACFFGIVYVEYVGHNSSFDTGTSYASCLDPKSGSENRLSQVFLFFFTMSVLSFVNFGVIVTQQRIVLSNEQSSYHARMTSL